MGFEALPDGSKRQFTFHTSDGNKIAEYLGIHCHAILSNIKDKEREKQFIENEKKWDNFMLERAKAEIADEVKECPSPLFSPTKSQQQVPGLEQSAPQGGQCDLLCGS